MWYIFTTDTKSKGILKKHLIIKQFDLYFIIFLNLC